MPLHTLLSTAPEVADQPQLEGLLFGVAIFILLMAGMWILLRFLSAKGLGGGSKHMKVIDRLAISRDSYIMLLQVGGRLLVVAHGKDFSTLLCELNPEETSGGYRSSADSAGSGFLQRFGHHFKENMAKTAGINTGDFEARGNQKGKKRSSKAKSSEPTPREAAESFKAVLDKIQSQGGSNIPFAFTEDPGRRDSPPHSGAINSPLHAEAGDREVKNPTPFAGAGVMEERSAGVGDRGMRGPRMHSHSPSSPSYAADTRGYGKRPSPLSRQMAKPVRDYHAAIDSMRELGLVDKDKYPYTRSGEASQSPNTAGAGFIPQPGVPAAVYGSQQRGAGVYGSQPGGAGVYGSQPGGTGAYGPQPGGAGVYDPQQGIAVQTAYIPRHADDTKVYNIPRHADVTGVADVSQQGVADVPRQGAADVPRQGVAIQGAYGSQPGNDTGGEFASRNDTFRDKPAPPEGAVVVKETLPKAPASVISAYGNGKKSPSAAPPETENEAFDMMYDLIARRQSRYKSGKDSGMAK